MTRSQSRANCLAMSLCRVPSGTLTVICIPINEFGHALAAPASYTFANDTPVSFITIMNATHSWAGVMPTAVADVLIIPTAGFRWIRNLTPSTQAVVFAADKTTMIPEAVGNYRLGNLGQ